MMDKNYIDLSIDERREQILQLMKQNGKVKVADMSKLFGISEVTIRNDLSDLEKAGVLERIHGGAISTNKAYYNMSLHDRMKTNETEKRNIAVDAASLISDGDTIMINSGTTTLFTVQALRNVKNLTLLTNSLSIAEEVSNYNNIHVIFLGGSLDSQYKFTYGDDTLNQLKKYKADKLILSADGISLEEGVTTYHHLEAEVNRQMIERAKSTILVLDFTKIGRASFAKIDSLDNIDILITNSNANKDEIGEIIEKGIEVRLV